MRGRKQRTLMLTSPFWRGLLQLVSDTAELLDEVQLALKVRMPATLRGANQFGAGRRNSRWGGGRLYQGTAPWFGGDEDRADQKLETRVAVGSFHLNQPKVSTSNPNNFSCNVGQGLCLKTRKRRQQRAHTLPSNGFDSRYR